jgi:hypothetical protein
MTEDWTPAIGWWKAVLRIFLGSALSIIGSVGAAAIVIRVYARLGVLPDAPVLRYESSLWGTAIVAAGVLGGLAVSWRLVENTSLVGWPLIAAAAAGLALAQAGACWMGTALLDQRWAGDIIAESILAGVVAVFAAAWRILVDS